MLRLKAESLIFGYRIFTFDLSIITSVITLALNHGIICESDTAGHVVIRERDRNKFITAMGDRFEYTESHTRGLFGWIKENKNRYGTFLGIFVAIFVILFSSDRIWDVRISGNERFSESEILSELSSCGFNIGNSWRVTDTSVLETEILSSSSKISWININRRGTVAYVDIVEKQTYTNQDITQGYSSIVAANDCIVEEITVKRGYAQVKVGDTVKKGDVLISGIIPNEIGGGFCVADGEVIGRCFDTVTVEEARVKKIFVPCEEKKVAISINILNFCINILKYYGNSSTTCDIIENNKDFILLGRWKLPVSVHTKTAVYKRTEEQTLTDSELTASALMENKKMLDQMAKSCELLSVSTNGYFTNDGYTLVSQVVYKQRVGRDISLFDFSSEVKGN